MRRIRKKKGRRESKVRREQREKGRKKSGKRNGKTERGRVWVLARSQNEKWISE